MATCFNMIILTFSHMMKLAYTGFLVLLITLAAGCVSNVPCVSGSGNVKSETRTVGAFQSIDLQGTGNIYVTQGNESSLRVEAEDNLLPYLQTNVTNGILRVGMNQSCVRNTRPINVYATMRDVRDLSVGGAGNIVSQSPLTSDRISVGIAGSGSIDLNVTATTLNSSITGAGSERVAGKVSIHRVTIAGTGTLDAFDLGTATTIIDITGTGNAKVTVSENLTVKISGAGTVMYRGNPTVSKEITGVGSVNPA